jgi:hypothetical protein
VDPEDPQFLDAVFADLIRISRSPTGHALLDRLRAAGRTITICKPVPAPDPPNAWVEPAGSGGELLVVYNPADWPCPAYLDATESDVVLFGRLAAVLFAADGGVNPAALSASYRHDHAVPSTGEE